MILTIFLFLNFKLKLIKKIDVKQAHTTINYHQSLIINAPTIFKVFTSTIMALQLKIVIYRKKAANQINTKKKLKYIFNTLTITTITL